MLRDVGVTRHASVNLERRTHRAHKLTCLLNSPFCKAVIEWLSLVIGDQAQVFDLVERLAQLDGHTPGLYQMKAERRNESVVSPCKLGHHRRSRGNQGRAGGVEHCAVGAIAGAVRIACIQQHLGRQDRTTSFGHQFGLIHRRTPSRAMFCNSRGFE